MSDRTVIANNMPVAENWCVTKVNTVETSYKWIIKNLNLCLRQPSTFIESMIFTAPNHEELKWQLKLYPAGKSSECKDHISLSLSQLTKEKKPIFESEFSIINNDGVENYKLKKINDHGINEVVVLRFVKIQTVWSQLNTLLCNNTLQLLCKLRISLCSVTKMTNNNVMLQPQENKPQLQALNDFQKLRQNKKFNDIILISNKEKFYAQKVILAARSSVFSDIFKNKKDENGAIEVYDIDLDCKVLTEVLRFIYTGTIQNIENLVRDLLKAADKYALEGLKSMCEMHLCESLTINNVFDILAFADQHNANKLKKQAINFIINNGKDVINMPEFKSLGNLQSSIKKDIFCKLFSQKTF